MFISKIKNHKHLILLIIGILIVVWLVTRTDLNTLKASLLMLDFSNFLVLILLQILTFLMIVIQWKLVFNHMKQAISYKKIAHMNLVGVFFESITPAVKIGGEAYKVIYLCKHKFHAGTATAAVATQKAISMLCFMILSLVSIIMLVTTISIDMNLVYTLWISFSIIFFSIFVIIGIMIYSKKHEYKRFGKYRDKINNFKLDFYNAFKPLILNKFRFIIHLILGLSIWLLFAYKTYYIFLQLGIDLDFTHALIVTFIAYMIGMLPLFPGGLGTFEGAMVLLLAIFTIEYNLAITVAIILRFITFWMLFILSILYLGFIQITKEAK